MMAIVATIMATAVIMATFIVMTVMRMVLSASLYVDGFWLHVDRSRFNINRGGIYAWNTDIDSHVHVCGHRGVCHHH
jgi:hypothetical protein